MTRRTQANELPPKQDEPQTGIAMKAMLWATLTCSIAIASPCYAQGLPGMRGADHIGFTVPNVKDAVAFFEGVIGCKAFTTIGPFAAKDNWMKDHLNVQPRAQIPLITMVRCGHGTNFEIFEYQAPDQRRRQPKNSDIGGHHIAFYVDDMDKAVAYLKSKGLRILGDPTKMTEGPTAGETWVYFLAPWGMQLELVSSPDGKAYEKTSTGKLWNAAKPGE